VEITGRASGWRRPAAAGHGLAIAALYALSVILVELVLFRSPDLPHAAGCLRAMFSAAFHRRRCR
jgi:hypothetical protein